MTNQQSTPSPLQLQPDPRELDKRIARLIYGRVAFQQVLDTIGGKLVMVQDYTFSVVPEGENMGTEWFVLPFYSTSAADALNLLKLTLHADRDRWDHTYTASLQPVNSRHMPLDGAEWLCEFVSFEHGVFIAWGATPANVVSAACLTWWERFGAKVVRP